MNWHRAPFIRLLFPLSVGIIAAFWMDVPIPYLSMAIIGLFLMLIAFVVKGVSFGKRIFFGGFAQVFLCLLGYQLTIFQNDTHEPQFFARYLTENQPNTLIGVINSQPEIKNRVKALLKIHSTQKKDSCIGNLLVYFDSTETNLRYGDVIAIHSKIFPIAAPKNPEAFDFQSYMYFQKTHYQCFLRKNQYKMMGYNRGNPLLQWAYTVNEHCVQTLKKYLTTKNELSVAAALTVGYRNAISEEINTAYADTGAMHVLSVSGLHVGFLYLFLRKLLDLVTRKEKWWKWTKFGLVLVFLWAFALISGGSAAVLRAVVMFSFLALGQELRREVPIYNILAASAFILLCYNPYLLADVGFQLSYLGMLGIFYFYQKIYPLLYVKSWILNQLWQATALGISAQLTTAPLSIYYFHQFPMYFMLSGVVVVFLAALILGVGMGLFLVDWCLPALGSLLGKVLFWLVWSMNQVLFYLQKLPFSVWDGIWLGIIGMTLLYIALGFVIGAIETRRLKWGIYAVGLLCVLSGWSAWRGIDNWQKREFVVYSIFGKTLIECYDGENAYALASEGVTKKQIQFAADNYRMKRGIKNITIFPLKDTIVTQPNWCYVNGIVQFYDKRIAIFKNIPNVSEIAAMHLDFMLPHQQTVSSTIPPNSGHFYPKIIRDLSNKKSFNEQTALINEQEDIFYYDMEKKPAFNFVF
jgi:competence protein ComEC